MRPATVILRNPVYRGSDAPSFATSPIWASGNNPIQEIRDQSLGDLRVLGRTCQIERAGG